MSDAERVAALDELAAGGRAALTELRQLLGVLRDSDDGTPSAPVPGIAAGGASSSSAPVARGWTSSSAVRIPPIRFLRRSISPATA